VNGKESYFLWNEGNGAYGPPAYNPQTTKLRIARQGKIKGGSWAAQREILSIPAKANQTPFPLRLSLLFGFHSII
jgi:hypothetical protein